MGQKLVRNWGCILEKTDSVWKDWCKQFRVDAAYTMWGKH